MPRQELRRLRNRTLSGLDSLRLGEQSRERSHSLTIGSLTERGPRTPCTPTFSSEKDSVTNFVEFNPAGDTVQLLLSSGCHCIPMYPLC